MKKGRHNLNVFHFSKTIADKTSETEKENSSGSVAAVVVVVLLLVLIAACGVVYFLHRQGMIQVPFLPPSVQDKCDLQMDNTTGGGGTGKNVPQAVKDYEKHIEGRKHISYIEDE